MFLFVICVVFWLLSVCCVFCLLSDCLFLCAALVSFSCLLCFVVVVL